MTYNSNCYGFVYAGLKNSEDEFFKSRDDLKLWKVIKKWKICDCVENTCDEIMEDFGWTTKNISVIELFDGDGTSQHVAFLTQDNKIYDQDGPDGDIRNGNISLDDLLAEYVDKFTAHELGKLSFEIHELNEEQEKNVENFINNL